MTHLEVVLLVILQLRSMWIPLLLWILSHPHLPPFLLDLCWRPYLQSSPHMDNCSWTCSIRLVSYKLSLLPLVVPLHQLHPQISHDFPLAIRHKKGECIEIGGVVYEIGGVVYGIGGVVFFYVFWDVCSLFLFHKLWYIVYDLYIMMFIHYMMVAHYNMCSLF